MGQSSSNREAATIFFLVGQNLCGKLSWQQYCLSTKQNIRLNKSFFFKDYIFFAIIIYLFTR